MAMIGIKRDLRPSNFSFTIKSYSKAVLDKYQSSVFEAGGSKWRLVLYPNGDKKRNGDGFISLYLNIAETESLSKGWEVNVIFRFFLFDHIQDKYLIIQDSEARRFHDTKREWGFAQLISLGTFKDGSNGYLIDDCCVFGIDVFVLTPTFNLECLSLLETQKCSTLDKEYNGSDEYITIGGKEWVLNKLTPENFDVLGVHLIGSGITSAEDLKEIVSLIFEKAISSPTFCPMYAQLCSNLSERLPKFLSDVPGEEVTFKQILVNKCQEEFEKPEKLREKLKQMPSSEKVTIKLRFLASIRLIGELWKQKMVPEKIVHCIVLELLGPNSDFCISEGNAEAVCQFMGIVSKMLDESPESRRIYDLYFDKFKEMCQNPKLAPHLRIMSQDVVDLRSRNWDQRRPHNQKLCKYKVRRKQSKF